MKHKILIILIAIKIFTVSINIFAFKGTGTETDPYQIWTKYDLLAIDAHIGNTGKNNLTENMHYKLMDDIDSVDFVIGDLKNLGVATISAELHENYINESIENINASMANPTASARSFKGYFNGNNKKIKLNLIDSVDNLALFYHNSGTIKNVITEGRVINTSEKGSAAGLVTHNNGIITHCINNASVTGRSAAGIAAINYNTISFCTNNGHIRGFVGE